MSGFRDRIERSFESAAAFICRNARGTLLMTLLVFLVLASGMAKLTIDASNEAFLHPNDPILLRYNAFKEQFGREDAIVVAVATDALFSIETLERIDALHRELESEVPHLDGITSLINARETRGEADQLIVGELLADWPDSEQQLGELRARVLANPLYIDQLVSADERLTTLVLTLDVYSSAGALSDEDVFAGFDDDPNAGGETALLTEDELRDAVDAVLSVVARHEVPGFEIHVAGIPIVTEGLKLAMQDDMMRFMAMALATIAVCLLAMFQRIVGVVLPLIVVILSLLSTMGLMGHFGVSVKVPTVILPSFLLAVSVGAAVHVLAIFFQQMQAGADRVGAITFALGHSGLAIVLTSLTTAAGLGSFATAEVAPIADLGKFAALGTLLSLGYTIVLLPALLALLPVRAAHREQVQTLFFDRLLRRIADFSTGHAKPIAVVFLTVLVLSLASAAQLRLTHDVLGWLPSNWPVRQATEVIDRDLRGSVSVEMVIDTGRENGLYDASILNRMEALEVELSSYDNGDLFIGKVFSVADILKEINKALNENRPEFYRIPDNPDLIPQEFLLFENSGSDDLELAVDSRFQIARFSVRVPWRDALVYAPFLDEISARFDEVFGADADVEATGMISILGRTLHAAVNSMAKSYVIAFIAISAMMMALVGSFGYGALAMLPNLTPIVVVMGAMWWLSVPLNMFTMLVGSIAIGLAVDDTVHFMHNFRRYHAKYGDVREAVRETLHTTGRAMLVTSVVLGLGFYIFAFATLSNVVQFGVLTGTAIALALVANFLMLPALLTLTMPKPKEAAQ